MAELGEFSRFINTNETIFNGEETLGVWASQTWLKQRPDNRFILTYQVINQYEGRPDLISNILYNTHLLSWALIAFNAKYFNNGAREVLNWPRSGILLYYPSDEIVFPEVA